MLTKLFLEADAPAEIRLPVVTDLVSASAASDLPIEVLTLPDALIESNTVLNPGITAGGITTDGRAIIVGRHPGIAIKLMKTGQLEIDIPILSAASSVYAYAGDQGIQAVIFDKSTVGAVGTHSVVTTVHVAVVQLDLRF